jgi:hypothetical protein
MPILKSRFVAAFLLSAIVGGSAGLAPRAVMSAVEAGDSADPAAEAGGGLLSPEELDEVVGPIALYPDDLIAIVLPASTFPLDIVKAARFLAKREKNPKLEPSKEWDPSVLGLLNYPEVIKLMNDDLDWTWKLGTAVIDQQKDVMDAIQHFRQRAKAAGNLESGEQQIIVEEKETIIIQSASPEVGDRPPTRPVPLLLFVSVSLLLFAARRFLDRHVRGRGHRLRRRLASRRRQYQPQR